MNALGLVTAAGASTRMGGFPKPLLAFDDRRFVERILHAFDVASVQHRLVVLGYEAEEVRRRAELGDAPVLVNGEYEDGMLSSVRLGVRHARTLGVDCMFLWPVDYPCVPPTVLETLWETHRASGADVVLPTHEGERGHPALFDRGTFSALVDAPDSQGARAVVYADDTDVEECEVRDERVLVDVDTPEEYWTAVKRYGDGGPARG